MAVKLLFVFPTSWCKCLVCPKMVFSCFLLGDNIGAFYTILVGTTSQDYIINLILNLDLEPYVWQGQLQVFSLTLFGGFA